MKKLIMTLVFLPMLIIFTNKIHAQGEAAVPFLLLAPDSRAGGVGESGGGLADNSAAIFWNPAGIAFLTGSEASITHSKWLPQFGLDDLFYDYLTYRQYVEEIDGSITSSITFMNYGTFIRTGEDSPTELGTFRSFDAALTIGYAAKLHSDWGLGLNFRVIHSRLSDKPTAGEKGEGVSTTVSFDLATMWRPEDLNIPLIGNIGNKFSLGLNLSNVGPKIYYIDQSQADPIPTNFRFGMAFRLMEDDFNSLTLTTDVSKLLVDRADSASERAEFYEAIFTSWMDDDFNTELRDLVTSAGLEYWYGDEDFKFALRTGFFYEDPKFGNRKFVTIGAGIRYDLYGFDFSYITTDLFKDGEQHPLSDTLRFTLSIGWGATTSSIGKGFPRGI
ncbi:MAG: PorV/PorQ family protein [Ignavibacteriae bacterium]|nr:PorV/PorQ family protein [Ignavibacteriota bacterium]